MREYTLADAIDRVIDRRGVTPKKLGGNWSETGYRALSAKNVKNGHIVNQESIRFVNIEMYEKWMRTSIMKNDILITSEAPFGEVLFWDSDEKIVLSQRLFGLRCKSSFYPKYVYLYMTSKAFQNELENRSTGTTVTGLRQPELMKCTIVAPSYFFQKQIADMIYSIEKIISINENINDYLAS